MRKLAFATLLVAVTGCASVTRGVNNDIMIEYQPADAVVTTTLNHRCQASPCQITVPRKAKFQVLAEAPGHVRQVIPVNTRLASAGAAGFAGNVLAGGVVGMGVDAATGATLEHYPNPVVINLVPLDQQIPPAPVLETAPGAAPASGSEPTS